MASSDEQREPLLRKAVKYYENCPGCKVEERKEKQESYPSKELILVGLLVLCNALPISSLFPFIYFMVRDFHMGKTEDIGYYAGYIGSSFMFGRFLTSALWGMAADRYGRKPIMFVGVSAIIVFNTLFGMSTNFWMAVSTRFLLGIFNGLLGPVKAYASEVCRDEHQALGLSVVGTMWGIGLIIGPALGGFFAQPADKYPNIFSKNSLFGRFPYLLPCLCISAVALIGLVTTVWLPETLHKHPLKCEEEGDDNLEFVLGDNSIEEKDGHPLKCEEEGDTNLEFVLEDNSIEEKDGQIIEKEKDGPIIEKKKDGQIIAKQKVQKKSLFKNWPAMSSIIVYCVFSLHEVAYSEIFSLWAESPRKYGGLSYTTSDVGTILSFTGVGLLIFQLLIFPSLANFTGAILITRMAAMLTIPVLTSYTFISKLSGVSLWLVINCASLFKNILSVTTYTGTFLLLNNSVSQDQRGAANGIAMTGASLFKALGPAGGGSIFAWAQKHQDASFLPGNQMVFFILNAVVVVVIAMTFEPFLPRSTDRPN